MLLAHARPHVVRQYETLPDAAPGVATAAVGHARDLQDRDVGCLAWAVHLSHDGRRVVTVETWKDEATFRRASRSAASDRSTPSPTDVQLYRWVGGDGVQPTPVTDPAAGVVVIDVFRVWRPLLRPVSAFNLRNGRDFGRQPGCVSTTVMRSVTAGRIATYARWRTVEDFLAAFSTLTGRPVASTDDVNEAAARMTRGFLRTDYHAHDLVDAWEGATVTGG
ncbi:MAG: antibiotic biosynthesis monooxygenase family protein [Kineosporiaceae bacterium]